MEYTDENKKELLKLIGKMLIITAIIVIIQKL